MRILHVFDHSIPLHDGYSFRSKAILDMQKKLGWETIHITSSKHVLNSKLYELEETVDNLHFYRTLPYTGMLWKLPIINQLAVVKALKNRLEEIVIQIKPDIIHAHSPSLNGLGALKISKKLNIPLVYEVRAFWEDAAVDQGTSTDGGLRYKLTRNLETYVLKRVDAVTTICEGLRNDMIERGLPTQKITVIQNSVDPGKFIFNRPVNAELHQSLGLEGKNVIGFIGSFYSFEGMTFLVEAMPELLKLDKNIRLLLVGGGEEDEKIKDLVAKLGLEKEVLITGRVPHNAVQDYYGLVDIFVYPRKSIRLTELVTPLKPLEAMAQGKLVVASDIGGHRELIMPGITGELFESGSKAQMIEKILQLFSNRAAWIGRKQKAREYVEKERNWKTTVPKYEAIYKSLLNR